MKLFIRISTICDNEIEKSTKKDKELANFENTICEIERLIGEIYNDETEKITTCIEDNDIGYSKTENLKQLVSLIQKKYKLSVLNYVNSESLEKVSDFLLDYVFCNDESKYAKNKRKNYLCDKYDHVSFDELIEMIILGLKSIENIDLEEVSRYLRANYDKKESHNIMKRLKKLKKLHESRKTETSHYVISKIYDIKGKFLRYEKTKVISKKYERDDENYEKVVYFDEVFEKYITLGDIESCNFEILI